MWKRSAIGLTAIACLLGVSASEVSAFSPPPQQAIQTSPDNLFTEVRSGGGGGYHGGMGNYNHTVAIIEIRRYLRRQTDFASHRAVA
jgi:hypothetical protein